MQVTFLQTADPKVYAEMLAISARTVVEYCRRHDFRYESYLGIKRGFWPWQATYNRILQIKELVDRGFDGWVVYLDADAFIHDLDFDLRAYLADKGDYGAIMTPSMATDLIWDVNVGVILINLGHPTGRHIAAEWLRRFDTLSEDRLREASVWLEHDNDQDFIQQMLIADPGLTDRIYFQSTDIINSEHARFIRQFLRNRGTTFEDRLTAIAEAVQAIMPLAANASHASIRAGAQRDFTTAAIDGTYRGTLGREVDVEGHRNAAQLLEQQGITNGLASLLEEIIRSEEFHRHFFG